MSENAGRTFDLVTLGQLLLRLSPPNNERLMRCDVFEKQVGGAELNVAVGVSLLGLHTGIISKIPSHDIGSFMKGKIRSYGSAMTFSFMTNRRLPEWESTIMKTAHIPESRR